MNKKVLFVSIIVIVLLLAYFGYSHYSYKKELASGKSPLSLCIDYSYGCRDIEVNVCSELNNTVYKVNYDCPDFESRYFDSDLNWIANYASEPVCNSKNVC